MKQPIYSAEEEQLLMSQIWSPQIKDDPEAFVMFMFPWGQEGTPLAKFTGPRKWQRRLLRKLATFIKENNQKKLNNEMMKVFRAARSSGRGIGKSALVSWLILWMLSTRIGSSVIVSANSETQLKKITWGELTKWVTLSINAHWFEITATHLVPATWLTALVERDLKIGERYWGAEGKLWSEENPDAYAGLHNMAGVMVIFDEASGIADSIWPVAAGYFTEEIPDRYWFAFSNPRRSSGYFYECFHSKSEFWDTEQIDARTVEGTDKGTYNDIIKEYGEESDEAFIEVYGEFPETGDEHFISHQLVKTATERPQWKDQNAPIVIGVDPARGGDYTVIAVRKGRDIIFLKRFKSNDNMVTVAEVAEAIQEFKPNLTVIDEGGLGSGVLDRLKELNYRVRGVNFKWSSRNPAAYVNKRAEMWGLMREWLRTASIPKDKRLAKDLTTPKRKPDKISGAMGLESKADIRARGEDSPDSADAIAVTFAFPVASSEVEEMKKRKSSSKIIYSSSWMGA